MSASKEVIVTLPGKRRVDAQVGRHVIHTDQPVTNGGEDSAASPFDTFLAAMGACAGIFIQGFCAKRDIPYADIKVVLRPHDDAQGDLEAVDFEIQVPPSFPEKYRDALVNVVDKCSVKRAIQRQPTFTTHTETVDRQAPAA